jgi:hypothetical protein
MDRGAVCLIVLVGYLGVLVFIYDILEAIRKSAPAKISNNSGVVTNTLSYNDHDIDNSNDRGSAAKNMTYLTNEAFKQTVNFRRDFEFGDTEQVEEEDPSITCLPKVFGYSETEGKRVFPDYIYPECRKVTDGPFPEMKLDIENNRFSMKCPEGEPFYLKEPNIDQRRLYQKHELISTYKVEDYKGPVNLKHDEEFVFGGCDKEVFLNNAVYIPRKNHTSYEAAKKKMKEHSEKTGVIKKPQIMFLLTIDSFSRPHFFRKLPKTVEFLNQLNKKSEFAVFDMKLHNIVGPASADNIVPIFGSKIYVDIPVHNYEAPPDKDVLGDTAMWNILREYGYMTYLGFEDCDNFFPTTIGKYPNADHLTRNFYCAAFSNMHVGIAKAKATQRCIGPEMSHHYILNYTQEFSRLYPETNQWIYLHLNAAHEASGQHAQTLDPYLPTFLEKYIETYSKTHEITIFLQGDHGMRYGNWFKDIEAYQENKLPALFIITSTSILDRIPYSYDTLWHNSFHLTTKPDIRASMLDLAGLPFDEKYPVHSDHYLDRYISLFTEKSPCNRTCEMMGVNPWYCSCLTLSDIDPKHYQDENNRDELGELVYKVALEAVETLNSRVYYPTHHNKGLLCQRLSLNKVVKAYGLRLGNIMEQIQVEFTVNEHKTARFEGYSVVGTRRGGYVMSQDTNADSFAPYPYRNFKAKIRVRDR